VRGKGERVGVEWRCISAWEGGGRGERTRERRGGGDNSERLGGFTLFLVEKGGTMGQSER